MKKHEKLKVILLTVAVTLTVEIFIVSVLNGFGIATFGVGPQKAVAGQNSDNVVSTEITENTEAPTTTSTTETTTEAEEETTTSKKKKTTARATTTTKNNTGDNDAGWVPGWH